jgi:hypothetical protein
VPEIELEGLDPSDPYRSVIECSSYRQCDLSGGTENSPFERSKKRKKPYDTTASDRKVRNGIYFLRVGTGRKGSSRCGEATFTRACSDPNCPTVPRPVPHTCYRYDCPTCYHEAVRRNIKKSAHRIDAFPAEFREETGLSSGKKKHLVFTFDPKVWTRDRCISDAGRGMFTHLDKMLKVAANNGFYALEAMIHLQRKRHEDGTECHDNDCQRQHIWVWGPHIHAVGYAFLMSTEELHLAYPQFRGINLIQVKEQPGQERDSVATLQYLGTHASVFYRQDTRKQASRLIKHLGFTSPHIFKQKLLRNELEASQCDCGQPIKVYSIKADGMPDRMTDWGPHYERRPIYEYSFDRRRVAEWMRNREHLGRVWLSRKASALRTRLKEIPYPEGDRGGARSPDGGIPHDRFSKSVLSE